MISPSISPLDLKNRIDAGQVWVPIRKAEMLVDGCLTGYKDVAKVAWFQGEELSPFDLGLDVGVVSVTCTVRKSEESTHFDPCAPISTLYGLITEDCPRYVKTCASCKDTQETPATSEEVVAEEAAAPEEVPAAV